jgi:hypothetical protein
MFYVRELCRRLPAEPDVVVANLRPPILHPLPPSATLQVVDRVHVIAVVRAGEVDYKLKTDCDPLPALDEYEKVWDAYETSL